MEQLAYPLVWPPDRSIHGIEIPLEHPPSERSERGGSPDAGEYAVRPFSLIRGYAYLLSNWFSQRVLRSTTLRIVL